MNVSDFKDVIKFILHTSSSIDARNIDRLNRLKNNHIFSLRDIRFVYRIAIDNGIFPECPWCKNAITDSDTLTLDHKFPTSKGGSDDITNIQPMHKKCNEVKGNIISEDIQYETTMNIHVKPHSRSNIDKIQNRTNRQSVINATNEQELMKKCAKYDQTKYELHKGPCCKRR